jgi:hypothetical protein
MLKANTVITGAKASDTILARFKSSPIFHSRFREPLKLSFNIRNGDATMIIQRYPILMISTTASAIKGKKSMIAKAALISISQVTLPALLGWTSDICAKLSIEEYIVTNGPTNHLDLSISEESVIALVLFWNRLVHHESQSLLRS